MNDAAQLNDVIGDWQPPSFPAAIANALDQLRDNAELSEISHVLAADPGVTARILGLVNSATFSPRSPVASVKQASVMLGRNQLEALLTSIAAKRSLPSPSTQGFQEQRFWATASKRAILAGKVAEKTDPTRKSENFTAALLQDMAIPVLALTKDEYGSVLEYWHNSGEDLADLESKEYGWHHGMIAGQLSNTWNFPDELQQFMSQHHQTSSMTSFPAAVSVSPIREADRLGDELFVQTASELFDLESDLLVGMLEDSEAESSALSRMMS
jgi:HD-like signal output (HDOD) protein